MIKILTTLLCLCLLAGWVAMNVESVRVSSGLGEIQTGETNESTGKFVRGWPLPFLAYNVGQTSKTEFETRVENENKLSLVANVVVLIMLSWPLLYHPALQSIHYLSSLGIFMALSCGLAFMARSVNVGNQVELQHPFFVRLYQPGSEFYLVIYLLFAIAGWFAVTRFTYIAFAVVGGFANQGTTAIH